MTSTVLESAVLPTWVDQFLVQRGYTTAEARERLFNPSLEDITFFHDHPVMGKAVERLRTAIRSGEPIALYADRDVDGLTGLAILARSLRALGGNVVHASPSKGRGIDPTIIDRWIAEDHRFFIFIDCGTTDAAILQRLDALGKTVFVVDHHMQHEAWPPATAWIHPAHLPFPTHPMPAGCVMAFHLAHALWRSFLGNDPARLDYFLWSHLDLLALGILADRVPLVGDNRIFVWHGLRRLASTRKRGLHALLRFFKLIPRAGAIPVHEALWFLIPLLNSGGRLGHSEWTANILSSDDHDTVHEALDALLGLNAKRRSFQDQSVRYFTTAVQKQCDLENDPVLIVCGQQLEPSVSGLVAQQLAEQYQRPVFVFVQDGEERTGSGRGLPGIDLFSTISEESHHFVRFGGHAGAVGLTVAVSQFPQFREAILNRFRNKQWKTVQARPVDYLAATTIQAAEEAWGWLQKLEPLGQGFEAPRWHLARCRVERVDSAWRVHDLEADVLYPVSDCEWSEKTGFEGEVVLSVKTVTERKGSYQWVVEPLRRSEA